MLRPVVAFGMKEKGSIGDGIFSFLFARYVFCSIDNELLDGHRGHKIYSTKKWSKIKLFKGHYSASGLMYYLTLHSVMKSHALSIQSLIWQCLKWQSAWNVLSFYLFHTYSHVIIWANSLEKNIAVKHLESKQSYFFCSSVFCFIFYYSV